LSYGPERECDEIPFSGPGDRAASCSMAVGRRWLEKRLDERDPRSAALGWGMSRRIWRLPDGI